MVVISAVVAVVVVASVAGFCYRWLVLRSPVVCFYYLVLLVWLLMLLWTLLSLILLHHCDTGSGLPFCIHVL